MRKLIFLAAAAGMLAVSGCATGGGYYGGADYGYNYTGPADVWYDGYYGAYTEGYWGDGGAFFFRGVDGRYYRDRDGHFRGQAFSGGQHFMAGHRH